MSLGMAMGVAEYEGKEVDKMNVCIDGFKRRFKQ